METAEETFSREDEITAIESFLRYGENTFDKLGGHGGYFSGDGWAARCLRARLKKLKEE